MDAVVVTGIIQLELYLMGNCTCVKYDMLQNYSCARNIDWIISLVIIILVLIHVYCVSGVAKGDGPDPGSKFGMGFVRHLYVSLVSSLLVNIITEVSLQEM